LVVKDIRSMVVKVGTSTLTTAGRFDKRMVAKFADEVAAFVRKGVRVSVVSSGAIGAGMTLLKMRRRPDTMEGLQGAAAVGQRYLMQCYEEAFARRGLSTAQVLLTWDDLAQRDRFLNAQRTLRQIQEWGVVPVINENDTVATDEIRFGDNDRLSSLLAILIQADVLVILSDTNGLYENRRRGAAARRLQIVERMGDSIFAHVQDSATKFTVGGMRSKLSAIRMSVQSGIPVFLADGRDPRVLARLFDGEDVGTLFVPRRRGSGKRGWIRQYVNFIRAGRDGRGGRR
jgi:glutamate 5-kinase